ncbi:MAG: tryptophan--tRNA ligase [Candidatus Paceibacterota bacterium]|jgi:tryptophanyl-tRNA synthetase
MNSKLEIVLSGIRATGKLHFGNFLGAVRNFVRFQDEGNLCLYFIADWHTLTTLDDPAVLRNNVLEIAKDYLAAGLDPEKSIVYTQSSVPEIAELSLYLGMFQPLGELSNIPTYKDLVKKFPNRVTHGLISYPVLMAADILGPQTTLVPVGEDQVPNVELARELARRFNNRFGQTFIVPEMMKEMVKVPGLAGGKMGKSDSSNAVDINAPIESIRELYLKHSSSDPKRILRSDPGDPFNRCPGVYPLHEIITEGESVSRTIARKCQSAAIGCRDCKNQLVDTLASMIEPYQERRRELENKNDYVRDVLHEGGKKARKRFQTTIENVREKIGIRIY